MKKKETICNSSEHYAIVLFYAGRGRFGKYDPQNPNDEPLVNAIIIDKTKIEPMAYVPILNISLPLSTPLEEVSNEWAEFMLIFYEYALQCNIPFHVVNEAVCEDPFGATKYCIYESLNGKIVGIFKVDTMRAAKRIMRKKFIDKMVAHNYLASKKILALDADYEIKFTENYGLYNRGAYFKDENGHWTCEIYPCEWDSDIKNLNNEHADGGGESIQPAIQE